ncbi:MAG: hypothetical protein GXO21_07695, partial [Aquificae bacterium]|nr:hypothetical protein [Aquificota bacterium]
MKEIKEIEFFLKSLKQTNVFLSPKEKSILKSLLEDGYTVEEIKNILEKEIKKYPLKKRKKFSLRNLSILSSKEKKKNLSKDSLSCK